MSQNIKSAEFPGGGVNAYVEDDGSRRETRTEIQVCYSVWGDKNEGITSLSCYFTEAAARKYAAALLACADALAVHVPPVRDDATPAPETEDAGA